MNAHNCHISPSPPHFSPHLTQTCHAHLIIFPSHTRWLKELSLHQNAHTHPLKHHIPHNMFHTHKKVWESDQGHIGIGQILQQTWCRDHFELQVEKQDQLGGLCKRESNCSIDIGQQATNNSDQHVHATQWLSGPPDREDIRYYQQNHWQGQKHENHRRRFQRRAWSMRRC